MAKNNLLHGGGAAEQALSRGRPFEGLAAQAQAEVQDEYQASGAHAMVLGNAERIEAASRLYWNAITKAAEEGDIKTLDQYVARFGWLAGKAVAAWAEVRKGDKQNKGRLAEVLTAYSEEITETPQEGQGGQE